MATSWSAVQAPGRYRPAYRQSAGSSLGIGDRRRLLVVGDVLAVMLGGLLALRAGSDLGVIAGVVVILGTATFWLFALEAVDGLALRRIAERQSFLAAGLVAALLTTGLSAVIAALTSGLATITTPGFAWDLGLYLGLVMVGLTGWRIAYGGIVRRPTGRRNTLIVGCRETARAAARLIRRELARDYSVAGFVTEVDDRDRPYTIDGLPVLGRSSDAAALVRIHEIDQIIVATDRPPDDQTARDLVDAVAFGVGTTTASELFESAEGRFPIEDGAGFRLYALLTGSNVSYRLFDGLKRLIDVALALTGLIGVALVVPLVALIHAIEAPGPLFYYQRRVGKAGREFDIVKFRSMPVNAEANGTAQWARPNDQRVGRLGRILRRTHLDEIPQFWNILRGEMSFVGPRPERPQLIETLCEEIPCYFARHAVRPGLTGWAQVNYPYGSSVYDAMKKLEYDLYYIRHRGIWLDLICVLRTARAVALMTGR